MNGPRVPTGCFETARITDDLTLDALGMALARRRPPQGLVLRQNLIPLDDDGRLLWRQANERPERLG